MKAESGEKELPRVGVYIPEGAVIAETLEELQVWPERGSETRYARPELEAAPRMYLADEHSESFVVWSSEDEACDLSPACASIFTRRVHQGWAPSCWREVARVRLYEDETLIEPAQLFGPGFSWRVLLGEALAMVDAHNMDRIPMPLDERGGMQLGPKVKWLKRLSGRAIEGDRLKEAQAAKEDA